MDTYSSDRWFQVWDYLVSHDRLLLRSYKGNDNPKNIDILFVGVFYVELEADLVGLVIECPTPEELIRLRERVEPVSINQRKFFAISSRGRRYFIGAFSMAVSENEYEVGESEIDM